MKLFILEFVALWVSVALPAQSVPSSQGSQSEPTSATQEESDIEKIVFTPRSRLPDSPKPKRKSQDEDNACPGGAGNPCALLGGRLYFPDSWHITQHEKTWWEALKTPGMVFSTTILFASTSIDIEGTQHCEARGTCREANPLMGNSRAQKYGVAMPADAFVTWALVREKQHGRGVFPFFFMWCVSSVHLYYGVNGLRPQGHP